MMLPGMEWRTEEPPEEEIRKKIEESTFKEKMVEVFLDFICQFQFQKAY